MDVYVKRTYHHHTDHHNQCEDSYPFYDYRSRRHSTGSTFCPGQSEDNIVSLTQNAGMPQHLRTTQAANSVLSLDPCRVTLHIITGSCQAGSLLDLYQDVISWVDPHLRLFRITECEDAFPGTSHATTQSNSGCSDIPAIAISIFLKAADQNANAKEDIGSMHRADLALQMFQHPPWRFHHGEQLTQGKINVVSSNSQDFYYTSDDLPLWAVRHVHYGREHIRYVLYTSEHCWPEQVHFYQLILGLEPDVLRDDFCLFTMYTHDDYDVQFALKKLDSSVNIITLDNVHIHIKVKDIGLLVPLFPNVCRPISDVKWQTTDHNGNVIVLDSSQGSSSTCNINNNNIPYQTSDLEMNTEPKYISKKGSVGTKKFSENNRHVGDVSFQASELLIIPSDSRSFSHTQQLDTSSHSFDFEDFDIDLPSPPLRHASKTEEDDDSLCLTSTSEESGIQMQHGSEDLSFFEEENLRSCLRKNSALKIRHVKFKVRFKEEIEAFEDSFSWLSSGIDSESQSDAEMETSFRFNPLTAADSQTAVENHLNKGLNNDSANSTTTNFVQPSKDKVNKENKNLSCSVFAADYRRLQDTFVHQCSLKSELLNTSDVNEHNNIKDIQTSNNINKQLTAALLKTPQTKCNQQNHIRQQFSSSNLLISNNQNEYGDNHQSPVRKIPPDSACDLCQHSWRSETQAFTSIHRTVSSNKPKTTSVSFRHQTNNERIHSWSSSNVALAKSNRERQHKNRSDSVNIREKQECQLSTPSANDCGKQLISVEANPLDNKTQPDKRTQCNPFPQLQHFQNGQKLFWFDQSNKDLAQNGCSDIKDMPLKFTLKFDTCPTSGLSSKEEQIGFYV